MPRTDPPVTPPFSQGQHGETGWAEWMHAQVEAQWTEKVAVPALADSAATYVTTTGNDAHDGLSWTTGKATIQAAVNALPANGGTVEVGYGTFNVASVGRVTTGGTTGGNATITNASASNADLGAYVFGDYIDGNTYVTAVTPGVSFTVSRVLLGTYASANLLLSTPAVYLPGGVTIRGRGATFGRGVATTGAGIESTFPSATLIADSGSGITILAASGFTTTNQVVTRYGLENLSVWGNSGNLYGLVQTNGAWFFNVENCDLSFHGRAGLAMGGNINGCEFRNTTFSFNGTAGATYPTGGALLPWTSANPSQGLLFTNCLFCNNYGFGIASGGIAGEVYNTAANLTSCTIVHTYPTAVANSGTGAWLGQGASAQDSLSAVVIGCFFGSTTTTGYNLITTGPVPIIGTTFGTDMGNPAYSALIHTSGASFTGCTFNGATTASIKLQSAAVTFSWNGCQSEDPYFYGSVAAAVAAGMGSLAGSSTFAPSGPFSTTSKEMTVTSGAQNIGGANRACFQRLAQVGPGTPISSIVLNVAAQSGNVCVAVYTSAPGRANPVTRIATSGSVACPALGTHAIALDVSVIPTQDTWFAISADNNTATFEALGASSGYGVTEIALGVSAYQDGAFPLPATAAPTACRTPGYILVGV